MTPAVLFSDRSQQPRGKYSATGTPARVARVRAEYPNQLDYSGFCPLPFDQLSPTALSLSLSLSPPKVRPVAMDKKISTLPDSCVSSLRRGHANLLCIVPSLTDDPRRESVSLCCSPAMLVRPRAARAVALLLRGLPSRRRSPLRSTPPSNSDTCGIRTHAGRPHWLSRPMP